MNRQKLMAELARDEGVRFEPYLCSGGYLTVGVGWNLEANGLPGPVVAALAGNGWKFTPAIVNDLLDISIDQAVTDAEKWLGIRTFRKLSDVRQRAFVNMAFNLGLTRLSQFDQTRRHAMAGHWDKCAAEMLNSVWARQVGPRASRLAEMVGGDD